MGFFENSTPDIVLKSTLIKECNELYTHEIKALNETIEKFIYDNIMRLNIHEYNCSQEKWMSDARFWINEEILERIKKLRHEFDGSLIYK